MHYRATFKNYRWPGTYHITIRTNDDLYQPLGKVAGDTSKKDDEADAPHVALSPIGAMVEEELTSSITAHYPMIEIQDHVVMPEHLHFIVVVHKAIFSKNGRETHLGQVIAGFKKGCNRKYWEITGQAVPPQGSASGQAAPPQGNASGQAAPPQGSASGQQGKTAATGAAMIEPSAVSPKPGSAPLQPYKVPSDASTGRPPLFDQGYTDVMPLREGQLETQRQYIRNNPRSRLLRTTHRDLLQPKRDTTNTALLLTALKGYLQRECAPSQFSDDHWTLVSKRLHITGGYISCDSYGDVQLLEQRLLPVVCHRKDQPLFEQQKQRCLEAAATGIILVSARIAKGEQTIIKAALDAGYPVITIEDHGFPTIYHPSEQRISLCLEGRLLIMTPWLYFYRPTGETISVAECKTMNCVVQALCRTKDSWWKQEDVSFSHSDDTVRE